MDDVTMVDVAPFVLGWLVGWALLWRPRPLPSASRATDAPRAAVSVIVPARDEAHALPSLLGPLRTQLHRDDEVIVVDDHSTDATATVARDHGATLIAPPPPPAGWLGKPNACWHGAATARNGVLVFLDADVMPRAGLLDGVVEALDDAPHAIVSVQPWHEPGAASEHLSLFFNVAALMGAGRFSVVGGRVRPRVAFGPVLAVRRATYDRIGGHAADTVRGAHTEDIALARLVDRVELFTGRPHVAFRMYPGGLGELVRGWTRSIGTGAAATPPWAAIATAAWMWSLAAAPFVGWWAYALAVVQCGVLARRAGRFSPLLALVYPVALAVFVGVLVRSLWRFARRREVTWKGRAVDAR